MKTQLIVNGIEQRRRVGAAVRFRDRQRQHLVFAEELEQSFAHLNGPLQARESSRAALAFGSRQRLLDIGPLAGAAEVELEIDIHVLH